nr:hypothetical protein [uncultured Ruminococcus sp.]
MKAIKDNCEYTITTDTEVKTYKARGFDIYNDDGTIKEYGAGKKVSRDQYEQLRAENAMLNAENKKLKNKLKSAEKLDGDKELEGKKE